MDPFTNVKDPPSLGKSSSCYASLLERPKRLFKRSKCMRVLRSLLGEAHFGFKNKVTLSKALARPPGCAFLGASATMARGLLTREATSLTDIIVDSGSDITLISYHAWEQLPNPPAIHTGQKVSLVQVTGKTTITGYVELPVLFETPEGFVELSVEAYVVKGMNAPFILGNDFADQYSLSLIREDTDSYLQFGSSGRRCKVHNTLSSPYTDDDGHAFVVTLQKGSDSESTKKAHRGHGQQRLLKETSASLRHDTIIPPDTVLRVLADIHFPKGKNSVYVEKIVHSRSGEQDLYAVPDSLVPKDRPYLQLANFSDKPLSLKRGELLGYVHDPDDWLCSAGSEEETDQLTRHAHAVKTIIRKMVSPKETSEEVEAQAEIVGGPKTAEVPEGDPLQDKTLLETVDLPPHLTPEQRSKLEHVILKHEKAFGLNGRLGTHHAQVTIPLREGAKEVSLPPYTTSPAKREAIDKQMDSWLSLEVVEPSKSAWGFPVLIVYRNGKPRMCVDYRKLNAVTIPDEYPLPKQSDIVQALQGSQWLTTLDALAGFTQIEIAEEDRPKTAFRTHKGLFQFKRMPFGLRNGPSFFQRVMQNVLAPYLWIFSLVYVDDIVVFSPTFDRHIEHLDCVLGSVEDSGLTLSPDKCHFGYQSLLLLGQKVSRLGMSTHKEKVEAITALEEPKSVPELRTFLGMMVYFSSYVPFYAWIVTPLFSLLKKDVAWKWTKLEQEAWNLAREALKSAPVRAYAIPGRGFRLYTDACDYGLAGILQQVQPIAVKDLRNTRTYERLQKAYNEGKEVPSLVAAVTQNPVDRVPKDKWGATLDETIVHVERVVAYWSRVLKAAERNYSATEREALALKESLVKFQAHIEGERLIAITDHAALTWSNTFQNVNRRLMSWGAVFSAYPNMEIVHRAGRVHSNVDPISRLKRRTPLQDGPVLDDNTELKLSEDSAIGGIEDLPNLLTFEERIRNLVKNTPPKSKSAAASDPLLDEATIGFANPEVEVTVNLSRSMATIVAIADEEVDRFLEGYREDPIFSKILEDLQTEKDWTRPKHTEFYLDERGLLFYVDWAGHSRLCVPKSKRAEVLKEFHEKIQLGAHSGHHRTYNRIAATYFWPRMSREIQQFVRSCDVCQKVKVNRQGPIGLLRPIPVPSAPFEVVTMDFIPELPSSNGFDNILVIIDKLTKYGIFIPTTTNVDAVETARLFFKHVYIPYGMPKQIISDRDTRWSTSFWKHLTELMGSKRALTTSHHPQADGQTEVANQVVEVGLRTYVGPLRDDWSNHVGPFQHSYNTAVHRSTGYSPNFLLHGFQPREPEHLLSNTPVSISRTNEGNIDAEEFAEGMRALTDLARNAIHLAQSRQRADYNRGRSNEEFEEGDLVLINPHSMDLTRDISGKGKKLLPRYDGPFEIIQKLSPVTYRLRIPASYKIHPVISIAHLVLYRSSPEEFGPRETKSMNRADFADLPEFEVNEIINERIRSDGRKRYKEYLVRFEGFGSEADEWLNERQLTNAPDAIRIWKMKQPSNSSNKRLEIANDRSRPVDERDADTVPTAEAESRLSAPDAEAPKKETRPQRLRQTTSRAQDNEELHRLGIGRRRKVAPCLGQPASLI